MRRKTRDRNDYGIKPIPKDSLKSILKAYPDQQIVQELVREIRRLRRHFIGEELHCVSPIAERTGRRVKVLVNRLNLDAAIMAVEQGIAELALEVETWDAVSVDELELPIYMHARLKEKGLSTVADLITKTDKDLMYRVEFDDNDFIRVQKALKKLGVKV